MSSKLARKPEAYPISKLNWSVGDADLVESRIALAANYQRPLSVIRFIGILKSK